MADQARNQFDGIEVTHEYLNVLAKVLADTQAVVRDDLAAAFAQGPGSGKVGGLRLVDYKLQRLGEKLQSSRRVLDDIHTLRPLFAGERGCLEAPATPLV